MFTSYELIEHLVSIMRDYPEQSLTKGYLDSILYNKLNIDNKKLSINDKKSFDKNKEKALKALAKLGYIDKQVSENGELWFVKNSMTNIVVRERSNEVEIQEIVNNVKKDDAYNGIAIALTFIIISLYFYLNPYFFEIRYLSYCLSIFFAAIGIIGIGIELNRLSGSNEGIFDNLGVGIGIGLLTIFIWVLVNNYIISGWYINIIFILLLIFPIYGVVLGVIYLFERLLLEPLPTKVRFFVRFPLAIIQLAGAFLIIVQLLSIFGVKLFE